MAQGKNNLPPLSDDTSSKSPSEASSELRLETVQQLVIEMRANLDILTEMICLIYADGDGEKYKKTLEALEYRQQEAENRILDASVSDAGHSGA